MNKRITRKMVLLKTAQMERDTKQILVSQKKLYESLKNRKLLLEGFFLGLLASLFASIMYDSLKNTIYSFYFKLGVLLLFMFILWDVWRKYNVEYDLYKTYGDVITESKKLSDLVRKGRIKEGNTILHWVGWRKKKNL